MTRYALQYIEDLKHLLSSVRASADGRELPLEEGLAATVAEFEAVRARDGKVMFIGNGASAAIASHKATDFLKAVGIGACVFTDGALLTCLGNDLGYEHVFDTPIARVGKPADLLVAISSSGRSPNILNGARKARELGCRVLALSGFKPDNPLRALGDVGFFVPAESYGKVEVLHLALLHTVSDYMAGR